MVKVIIEVLGGNVMNVSSTEDIEIVIIDRDCHEVSESLNPDSIDSIELLDEYIEKAKNDFNFEE